MKKYSLVLMSLAFSTTTFAKDFPAEAACRYLAKSPQANPSCSVRNGTDWGGRAESLGYDQDAILKDVCRERVDCMNWARRNSIPRGKANFEDTRVAINADLIGQVVRRNGQVTGLFWAPSEIELKGLRTRLTNVVSFVYTPSKAKLSVVALGDEPVVQNFRLGGKRFEATVLNAAGQPTRTQHFEINLATGERKALRLFTSAKVDHTIALLGGRLKLQSLTTLGDGEVVAGFESGPGSQVTLLCQGTPNRIVLVAGDRHGADEAGYILQVPSGTVLRCGIRTYSLTKLQGVFTDPRGQIQSFAK